MSYTLEFPIQYIANPDKFGAIALGKMFIGVTDGDPATEPADRIQVYVARQNDTDLAITQPINLSAGGVPTYNGSPVTLKVLQEYSVAILDKNDQQVYYSPKAGEIITLLEDILAELESLNDRVEELEEKTTSIINTWADIQTTEVDYAGQIFILAQHTSNGVGGGMLIAKSGSVTDDGGTRKNSATAGMYLERTNYNYVTPEDFGAIGVTFTTPSVDCTAAFTKMFNWINAGGLKRVIIPPSKYGISDSLPQLIQSSWQILGSGTLSSQDGGITKEHSLLEWIGGPAPAKRMILIAPVSDITSARIDGVKLTGINIDCATGNLGVGVSAQSCRQSDFDLFVKNAGSFGFITGVVATLGESRDFRDNTIRYIARNTDGGGQSGIPLRLDGDAGANTCFNIFTQINVVSYNSVGIQEVNADNNLFLEVSTGIAAGGTATYSLECQGSNTGVLVRSEQFFKFSSNLPAVIRGTGLSSPAKNIKFYNLDKDNGCPDPVVESGASAYWQNDNSPMYHSIWASYVPTITASSGTFTSVNATGRYVRVVGGVHYSLTINVVTNGTAAGAIRATLPIQAGPGCNAVFKGYENTAGTQALRGVVGTNATFISISNDNGTYPGADAKVFILSGFYEVAIGS